jgi:ATP-dependent DNA ligase
VGNLRRFLQDKGRTGKLQVWEIQHTDNSVLCRWGQLDGAMQETVQTFEALNVGKSNEKSPHDVAKKACEDLIKKKSKSGYFEVNTKTNKPIAKVLKAEFDFNDPHMNSTNFKVFKPQSSASAYMQKLMDSKEALFTRKRDGYMHYLIVDDDGVADLYSSNMALTHEKEPNIPLIERFPGIQDNLQKLELLPRTMLVGEICTSALHPYCDDLGHAVDDFQYVGAVLKSLTPRALELQDEKGHLAFCIWDVVFCEGEPWVKQLPAKERFDILREMVSDPSITALTVPDLVELKMGGFVVTSADGEDLELEYDDPNNPVNDIVNWAKERRWEGFVVVDPDAVYGDKAWSFRGKNDRPKELCKLKPDIDVDVIVYWDPKKKLGEMGKGKHSGQVGSVAAFLWDGEQEIPVGKIGTGITDEQTKKFANPKLYPMVWQITAKGWTDGGKLRHGSLVRVRDDKKPDECGTEQMPGGGS